MNFRNILLIIGIISAVVLGYYISLSPPERFMGHVQKIMYIHVPAVFAAYVLYFFVFLFSWGYLWKRTENYDINAKVFAEVATLLTLITLITGSIWGKPTWNTYWTWDAKLTITLILFLIFCGYLILRKFIPLGHEQFKVSAIIGIIGFASVPLNHFSVKWWRSLHQDSTVFSQENTLSDEYRLLLYLAMAVMTVFVVYFISERLALEKKYREFEKQKSSLFGV